MIAAVTLFLWAVSAAHAYIALSSWRKGNDLFAAVGATLFVATIAISIYVGLGGAA